MRRVNALFPSAERWLATFALLACCLIASSALAQDACESDDECMDDLVCGRVLFGTDCDSGECIDVLEQGFCSEPDPEPLRCDDNGQCPQPLYCDDANPDGAICGYVELMCSSDDDECPPGFMCVDLEPLGGCTVCEDDQECMSLPCAENMLNVCSPIAVACEEDSDCEEGFVCREIGAFDLQTAWDETLVGTKGCLSVGLLAVADGFVQGGEDFVPPTGGSGEPSGGAGDGGASGIGAGSGGMSGSAGANGGANGGAGVGGASGASTGGASGMSAPTSNGDGDGGGCNVQEPERSRAPALAILLALLIAALLLRRWPVG